ncbi:MAG: alpha/beta fold hydrolase [Acidimicrobiia bacterium]
MNVGDVLKRTGLVAGVTAGVVGAAYATERAVVARIRHRDDPDAGSPLTPVFDEARVVDTHDGGALYTIGRGEGPPIVFAHGVTLTSRVWAKQFDTIPEAGFRVVAFDSRGHGESTIGESGHSVDNLADDLRSVLEALDLRDAVLVGHSMGGMAVQAFAIRHPEVIRDRVRGLVLMSTAARNLVSDAHRVRGAVERITTLTPDFAALMRQRNLGFLLARVGFGNDPHASHVEATRQMLAGCSRATLRDAGRAILALDLTEGLPSLTAPSLVLVGTADALTPPRDSRQIADLLPNARLVEFPGAGHMLMYERAEEVDDLIVEFARECTGSPKPAANTATG